MAAEVSGTPPVGGTPPIETQALIPKLLRVAWLSVLLGLCMEVLLLVVGIGAGVFPGAAVITSDFAQGVTWSVFVCVGLAIGTGLSRLSVPLAGFVGFLAAPIAFQVSRIAHRGIQEALSVAGTSGVGVYEPLTVAFVKGLEYACLGMVVGWLAGKTWGGLRAHALAGLAIGAVFGTTLVVVSLMFNPAIQAASLVVQGVNELLFPVGCSVVIFSASVLGKRFGAGG